MDKRKSNQTEMMQFPFVYRKQKIITEPLLTQKQKKNGFLLEILYRHKIKSNQRQRQDAISVCLSKTQKIITDV